MTADAGGRAGSGRGGALKEQRDHSWLGPTVFLVAFAAVLVFFWWLVIYDHGVPAGP